MCGWLDGWRTREDGEAGAGAVGRRGRAEGRVSR
jgi:hypothetical protein